MKNFKLKMSLILLSSILICSFRIKNSDSIRGIATASQNDPDAIKVIISDLEGLKAGISLKDLTFKISRVRAGESEEVELSFKTNAYGNNFAFDYTAKPQTWYEYKISIQLGAFGKLVEFDNGGKKILGYRPKRSNAPNVKYISTDYQQNILRLYWQVDNLNIQKITSYEIHFTTDSSHTGNVKMGLHGNPKGSFQKFHPKMNVLNIPLKNFRGRGWIYLKVWHEDGSTDFFKREIDIHEMKSLPKGKPRASVQPSIDKDRFILDSISQYVHKQFPGPGKIYGLSYLPKFSPEHHKEELYSQLDPQDFHHIPSVQLDQRIIRYLRKSLSSHTDVTAEEDCLETVSYTEHHMSSKGMEEANLFLDYNLGFLSSCYDYKLRSMKIRVNKVRLLDGSIRKKVVMLPNDLTLVEQYKQLNGLFVWRELPQSHAIDKALLVEIQKRLKALDHYDGEVDGTLSIKLRIAILEYQRKHNLAIGNIDLDTIQSLGLLVDEMD